MMRLKTGEAFRQTRLWARRGSLPPPFAIRAPNGPICSAPSALTAAWALRQHGSLGKAVSPGAHAGVLVFDGAGWHDRGELVMPENITPIMPAYSSELNPVEKVWEYLRKNKLANRLYETSSRRVRRLEQSDRSARPHRLHHQEKLGKSVMTCAGWYGLNFETANSRFLFRGEPPKMRPSCHRNDNGRHSRSDRRE